MKLTNYPVKLWQAVTKQMQAAKQWLLPEPYVWLDDVQMGETLAFEIEIPGQFDPVILCCRLENSWLIVDEGFNCKHYNHSRFVEFIKSVNGRLERNRQEKYWGENYQKLDAYIEKLKSEGYWVQAADKLTIKFLNEDGTYISYQFHGSDQEVMAKLYIQNFYFFGIESQKKTTDSLWSNNIWMKFLMLTAVGGLAINQMPMQRSSSLLSFDLVLPATTALAAMSVMSPPVALAYAALSFMPRVSADFSCDLLTRAAYDAGIHPHCFLQQNVSRVTLVTAFESLGLTCANLREVGDPVIACHGLYNALLGCGVSEDNAVAALIQQTNRRGMHCEEVLGDLVVTSGRYAEQLTSNASSIIVQNLSNLADKFNITTTQLQNIIVSANQTQTNNHDQLQAQIQYCQSQIDHLVTEVQALTEKVNSELSNSKNDSSAALTNARAMVTVVDYLHKEMLNKKSESEDSSQLKNIVYALLGLTIALAAAVLVLMYQVYKLKFNDKNDRVKNSPSVLEAPTRPNSFVSTRTVRSTPLPSIFTTAVTATAITPTTPPENPLNFSPNRSPHRPLIPKSEITHSTQQAQQGSVAPATPGSVLSKLSFVSPRKSPNGKSVIALSEAYLDAKGDFSDFKKVWLAKSDEFVAAKYFEDDIIKECNNKVDALILSGLNDRNSDEFLKVYQTLLTYLKNTVSAKLISISNKNVNLEQRIQMADKLCNMLEYASEAKVLYCAHIKTSSISKLRQTENHSEDITSPRLK